MPSSLTRACPLFRLSLAGLGAMALLVLFSGHADSQKREPSSPVNDGTSVRWEGWKFNWSLGSMEGLVLTDVHFRGRKVLNYAGIAELLTADDQGVPRGQLPTAGGKSAHHRLRQDETEEQGGPERISRRLR